MVVGDGEGLEEKIGLGGRGGERGRCWMRRRGRGGVLVLGI